MSDDARGSVVGDDARGSVVSDVRLEMVVLPVADVDRSVAYYRDALGWHLDVDHAPNEHFRVVQFTPPGSPCSVSFGVGLGNQDCEPGSYRGLHLVVTDVVEVRERLLGRGARVGEVFHFGDEGPADGPHPDRADFATYAELRDPDGHVFLLQERGLTLG